MFDPALGIRLAVAIFRLTRRRVQVIGSTAWPVADGKIFQSVLR